MLHTEGSISVPLPLGVTGGKHANAFYQKEIGFICFIFRMLLPDIPMSKEVTVMQSSFYMVTCSFTALTHNYM